MNINMHIMDRTGDAQLIISDDTALIGTKGGDHKEKDVIDQATAKARIVEEFGKGKWLRVVKSSGESETITDVTDLTDERMDNIFTDAFEVGMFNAIVGG